MYEKISRPNNGQRPWGYNFSEESRDILVPNNTALQVLETIIPYLKSNSISLRDAALFVTNESNVSITHEGLRKLIRKGTHPIFTAKEVEEEVVVVDG
jgi:hypothetical protein